MLDPMNDDCLFVLVNLIEDSVVAPSGRAKSFEFPEERFPIFSYLTRRGGGTADPLDKCRCYGWG